MNWPPAEQRFSQVEGEADFMKSYILFAVGLWFCRCDGSWCARWSERVLRSLEKVWKNALGRSGTAFNWHGEEGISFWLLRLLRGDTAKVYAAFQTWSGTQVCWINMINVNRVTSLKKWYLKFWSFKRKLRMGFKVVFVQETSERLQHFNTTLLGATRCASWATMLRCVATCWVLLANV